MSIAMRPWLAIAIAMAATASALAAGLQATGNAMAFRLPQIASTLTQRNPQPLDQVMRAHILVEEGATDLSGIDVSNARAPARAVLERSLLQPASLAILAWDAPSDRRAGLISAAAQIDRRDALLQSAMLREFMNRGDEANTLEVFNAMIRVRPGEMGNAIASLAGILQDDTAVGAFAELLATNPPWTNQFLLAAARYPEAADNLVQLRRQLPDGVEIPAETDRQMVTTLASAGSVAAAVQLYQLSGGKTGPTAKMDWAIAYPPFDWTLTDGYDAYARVREGGGLALRIRPGHGGELAARLITLPPEVGAVRIAHTFTDDMDLIEVSIVCAGTDAPLASRKFSASPFRVELARRPEGCEAQRLSISGRAWSSGQMIDGAITAIDFLR